MLKKLVEQILMNVVPTKKKLWVFGSWEGKLYADNAKYLFEYVRKTHPEINCVWLTQSEDVVKKLKQQGVPVYHKRSWRGVLTALRAEVAIETEGNQDISQLINSKKTKVIQLWHGMGAKAVKWKTADGINFMLDPTVVQERNRWYWMASCEKYIDVISEGMGVKEDRFIITGYPRNDTFITKPYNENMVVIKKQHPDCKFIMYMPTHRNFGAESISVDEFYRIDKIFKEKNWIMVYKPHFHELKNILHLESGFSNIILAKDQDLWADVYSYIHYFDLMISDYSSISYDFLCSGKPIVQYTYDLEHYKNADAGLFDFFEDVPLGPFCFSWDDVIFQIAALFEKDTWIDQRKKCQELFHPYNDGGNCKRVCDYILSLVDN